MESEQERGRTYRFRRWLAYKLLPGTNEFDVAKSRQLALFQLRRCHEDIPDLEKSRSIRTASDRLITDIPVRARWDKSDELRVDTDE